MNIKAVDLFCGAGGLTCGLQKSGIPVVAGVDIENDCRYAFEHNNHSEFINRSVAEIKGTDLLAFYKNCKYKVLVGCAPCQPFSMQTQKIRKQNNITDNRWFLLNEYARIVEELQPDIISMENVPLLAKQEIFSNFISTLKRNGYYVSYEIVFCPKYGIPQNRRRLVLLASRLGDIKLISPTHKMNQDFVTVYDVIGQLPSIRAGETDSFDSLHRAAKLSSKNLARIKVSTPGGSWKTWPSSLIADCHKKETGHTYSAVYARMEWNKPGPTITTQFYSYGSGRFGHPEQNRAISLREGALLQTFPPDYSFWPTDSFTITQIAKMIGNAVPVRLGEIIGNSIIQHVYSL